MTRRNRGELFQGCNRPAPPSLDLEDRFRALGHFPVAGVDEAGRGPLAGPVVAAAAILPPDLPPDHPLRDARDSKALKPEQRERLFVIIMEYALDTAWALCDPAEIDRMNILAASLEAMRRAVTGLATVPGLVLVDGNYPLPGNTVSRPVVKGDRICLSIAAASIVAKVVRDRIMLELHHQYPVYRFDLHKGYPTSAHKEAIRHHGPCPVHRKTFRGVTECLPGHPPPLTFFND